MNAKKFSHRFNHFYLPLISSGLKQLQENLISCISCLQNEQVGSYRRVLGERAKVLLSNVGDFIMYIDFL